jgi:hypothetical protein
VRSGDHLWKINQDGRTIALDQNVELIEITVDQAMLCQFNNHIHQV